MPTHCCVPGCTKKGYRDDNGSKISFFIFPTDKTLRKQWIHAIRRDEGKYFQIQSTTKVCSRHFKGDDFKRMLAGKTCLKPGVVPSVFDWRTSPRKRKPPTFRHLDLSSGCSLITEREHSENEEVIEVVEEPNEDLEATEELYREIGTQTDEDEMFTTMSENEAKIKNLEKEISALQSEIDNLLSQIESLRGKLFTTERFRSKQQAITFYTGFPNYEVFMAIFNYLNPGEQGENIRYWIPGSSKADLPADIYDQECEISDNKKGRARLLKPIHEYFLVMCRLRQGFAEEHLGHLFHVSTSTVSRILISWINFMYLKLGTIDIWPSREVIEKTMPEDFKAKYSSTRVIIDCTEVRCQMPSSLQLNGELFSNYKHHTTLKGLVGISPGGAVTFVSGLYTGSISDREIVIRSGLLDLPFNDKDSVMADKGFTVEDLLPLGVSLNIPPFLGSSSQMAAENVVRTQEIASLRIHIERAINKIKNFHIWDGVIPLNQLGLANQMWAVCAILCNAQPNIISV